MGIFKFRKFSVCDDHASMKVGTDAVLLGAWANVHEAKNILDIGTGLGVIALMMAQRTNDHAHIDAVELQVDDAKQAMENVANSPWSDKISVYQTAIQVYQTEKKYDLILCNPPFFMKSLLPPKASRQTVRHDTSLNHADLLEACTRLLTLDGKISVILPPLEGEEFIKKAGERKLFLSRYTRFFTREGKKQERSLLEFQFRQVELIEDELMLYESGIERTQVYKNLTKDFYLERR